MNYKGGSKASEPEPTKRKRGRERREGLYHIHGIHSIYCLD